VDAGKDEELPDILHWRRKEVRKSKETVNRLGSRVETRPALSAQILEVILNFANASTWCPARNSHSEQTIQENYRQRRSLTC